MKQDKEFEQFAKGLRQEVEETFDYIKDTGEITNFVRSKIQKAWNYQQQKLAKAEAALKVAEEAIDFYSERYAWTSDIRKRSDFGKPIFSEIDVSDHTTFEYKTYNHCTIGGKRARQAKKRINEIMKGKQ